MSKLEWSWDGDVLVVRGVIDEGTELPPPAELKDPLVLDLAGVQRINSIGVREWVDWLTTVSAGRAVRMRRCASVLVRQFGMVPTTRGDAEVESIMLPYFCEECDDDRDVLWTVEGAPPDEPEAAKCPECGEEMEFDDVPSAFFAFLTQGGAA